MLVKIIIFKNEEKIIFKNDYIRYFFICCCCCDVDGDIFFYIDIIVDVVIYGSDVGCCYEDIGFGIEFCRSDVVNCTAQTDYVNQNRTFI